MIFGITQPKNVLDPCVSFEVYEDIRRLVTNNYLGKRKAKEIHVTDIQGFQLLLSQQRQWRDGFRCIAVFSPGNTAHSWTGSDAKAVFQENTLFLVY